MLQLIIMNNYTNICSNPVENNDEKTLLIIYLWWYENNTYVPFSNDGLIDLLYNNGIITTKNIYDENHNGHPEPSRQGNF